jgi:hypothetical protein
MHDEQHVSEADLCTRLRTLADIEEIKNLKARYCHYCNTGWEGAGSDAAAVTALFAEDGVFDTPMTGRLVGRAALGAQFADFGLKFVLALHIASSPEIEVHGDEATGRWQGLNALTSSSGESFWSGGCYEERYVRTPAGWRFAEIVRRTAFVTPQPAGWNAGSPNSPPTRYEDAAPRQAWQG